MRVVISVNPHEGMCRLEMKLHGYVLINAISFHQRWLLWHFVPSKRGDKTDRFRSCQIRRLIYCSAFKVRYQCQPESVRIRLAISGSKTDNWRLKNDKKHTRGLIRVLCRDMQGGSWRWIRVVPPGPGPKKQNSTQISRQWDTIDVMLLLGFKARLLYVTFKRTVVTSRILWITR